MFRGIARVASFNAQTSPIRHARRKKALLIVAVTTAVPVESWSLEMLA